MTTIAGIRNASLKMYRPETEIIWCGGCPLGDTSLALNRAMLTTLPQQWGIPSDDTAAAIRAIQEKVVMVSGIGCTGRTSGYANLMTTVHTAHGRAIPVAEAIKTVSPDKTVIVVSGDGDLYDIGLNHLMHAAQRGTRIIVICYDNRIFAMTSGQASSRTPRGERTVSSPRGARSFPLNPTRVLMALDGIAFIAQGALTNKEEHLHQVEALFAQALASPGFAFVNVVGTCHTERKERGVPAQAFAHRRVLEGMVLPYPDWLQLSLAEQNRRYGLGVCLQREVSPDEEARPEEDLTTARQIGEVSLQDLGPLVISPRKTFAFAGISGMGTMTLGDLMQEAASRAGLRASAMGDYGAAQRGNQPTFVVVTVAEGGNYSAVPDQLDVVVALTQRNFDIFTGSKAPYRVAPNGVIIVNSSAVAETGDDPRVISSPMGALLAEKVKPKRPGLGLNVLSFVISVAFSSAIPREALEATLLESGVGRKDTEFNRRILSVGYEEADRLRKEMAAR